jgi:hypothetical protein
LLGGRIFFQGSDLGSDFDVFEIELVGHGSQAS